MHAWFLVGPTAVGKSAVAQWIAEHGTYDVLSADSMLVYRHMDIGTAKPRAEERARVRYYGIDLVEPDRPFSVWAFREHALVALREIAARGREALVVGGTGLYVKCLTEGLDAVPGDDSAARARWTSVLSERGIAPLQDALRRGHPALYEALDDKQNPRRLVRALEMAEHGSRRPPRSWRRDGASAPMVGLSMALPVLHKRIESRVDRMYREGFVEEVRRLVRMYGALSPTAGQAIGYAEALGYLEGRSSRDEAIARTAARTRQLAKRQRTWFRHQADVRWIDVASERPVEETAEQVLVHWKTHGPSPIAP